MSLNVYRLPPLIYIQSLLPSKKKTFSKLAHQEFHLPSEVWKRAFVNCKTSKTLLKRKETVLFPLEILRIILHFLEIEDLRTCLKVSKGFNAAAFDLFIQKAFPAIQSDFAIFEIRLNYSLKHITPHVKLLERFKIQVTERGRVKIQQKVKKISRALRTIQSFKCYFALLQQSKDRKMEDIDHIGKSILIFEKKALSLLEDLNWYRK